MPLLFTKNCRVAALKAAGETTKRSLLKRLGCTCLKGKNACQTPISIPETELDKLVLGALADQLMTPDRLVTLLREAIKHRRGIASQSATKRAALKSALKTAEAQIERLLAAVADGTIPDISLVRGKLNGLTSQRDECLQHLALLDESLPELRQVLSNQQARPIAAILTRPSWTRQSRSSGATCAA